MSYTSYDNQERRQRSDRPRRDRPVYREEEIIESRTGPRPSRQTDLVRRRDDSVEEVQRDFPPGNTYIQRRTARRARSDGRSRYDDDDRYEDPRRRNKRYDDRRGMAYPNERDPKLIGHRQSKKGLLAQLELGKPSAKPSTKIAR